MSTTKVQSDMVDIDGATTATIATGDKVNFLDITDSLVKEDTVQGILDLAGGGFTLASEQATASGTSVTFGSIPTGTKMIVINIIGFSHNSTSNYTILLGDGGGIETSGYISSAVSVEQAAATVDTDSATTSFIITGLSHATRVYHGQVILCLQDSSDYTWTMQAQGSTAEEWYAGSGSKSLSAELTQIKFSTVDGGTFDAGVANIMYQ